MQTQTGDVYYAVYITDSVLYHATTSDTTIVSWKVQSTLQVNNHKGDWTLFQNVVFPYLTIKRESIFVYSYFLLSNLSSYWNCTLQKGIGCFNHWIVTLVADRLRRHSLWEVYVGIRDCISNLSHCTLQLTTRACTLQLHFKNMTAGDFHRCSVVTISARSWLLLHAFWYKQMWHLPQLLIMQDLGLIN